MINKYLFIIIILVLFVEPVSLAQIIKEKEQNFSYEIKDGELITKVQINDEIYYLKIESFSEKSVKIHFSKNREFNISGLEKYGFINEKKEVDFKIEMNDNWILVDTGENHIKLKQEPFCLIINDLIMSNFIFENNSLKAVFNASTSEHFFGFGQKFSNVDQTGKRVLEDIRWGWTDDFSLSGVPFFMNTDGYGLFIDTTYKTLFDIRDVCNGEYFIQTYDKEFRFFYINGPSFKSILHEYTNITGRPSLPPRWTFGYWQSKACYKSTTELERIAKMLREGDYPSDVLVLDAYWRNDKGLEWGHLFSRWRTTLFSISKIGFFRDHKKMEQKLYEMGYKIILHEDTATIRVYDLPSNWIYQIPYYIHPEAFWPYKPVVLDFSNPSAARWYASLHMPLLRYDYDNNSEGADGFWLDELDWTPESGKKSYYNGMLPAEMHNLYPNLFNKNIFLFMQDTANRGVILTRSVWAGSQRYPWVWSGDIPCTFDAMKTQIIAGQTMGLSGYAFWGQDLGGYFGQPSNELQIRWTAEFGSFSPLFRAHGIGLNKRISLIGGREPWSFNKTAENIFMFYDKLRYRLLPYIYSCAYESIQTGIPIMRALILEFQDDEKCYDKDTEYMFGPSFLVAPVCEKGARERDIYLPDGKWIDYWDNKVYEGPIEFSYPAPLNVLPLFIRAGSIIPTGPNVNYTDEKPLDPLTLNIYPFGNSSFTLYEDDGKTMDYKSGVFAQTCITVNQSKNIINISIGKNIGSYEIENRGYKLIINCIDKLPVSVKIDDIELDGKYWHYDDENQRLFIDVLTREPNFSVKVGIF